jgi:hypothetical protein
MSIHSLLVLRQVISAIAVWGFLSQEVGPEVFFGTD